jgi:serine/threonine protein kinase
MRKELFDLIKPLFSLLFLSSLLERSECCKYQAYFNHTYQPLSNYAPYMNIELMDACFYLSNGYKMRNHFVELDQTAQTDDRFDQLFQQAMRQMNIKIERALGKGNYGRVFAAKSSVYGNVAVKLAVNKDGMFYDMRTRTECCHFASANCPRCQKPIYQMVPFEIAASLLALNANGVVQVKAFGVIGAYHKQMYYIILMDRVDNSMPLNTFAKTCLKKFAPSDILFFMHHIQVELNRINKNLIMRHRLFHNDLKADNILIKYNSKSCGSGVEKKFKVYMIDFGNAIVSIRVDQRNSNDAFLYANQYSYKKYFLYYRAPELCCDFPFLRLSTLLTWYLGVIAFELCSFGAENVQISPSTTQTSQQMCYFLKSNMHKKSSENSFDLVIQRNAHMYPFCSRPSIQRYIRLALVYNPNSRMQSDNLVKYRFD